MHPTTPQSIPTTAQTTRNADCASLAALEVHALAMSDDPRHAELYHRAFLATLGLLADRLGLDLARDVLPAARELERQATR